MNALLTGRVVAVHGQHLRVEDANGERECVTRGKRTGVACNDQVRFRVTSPDSGVVEEVLPRRNLLFRSVAHRAKLLAANVDQVLVVTAAEPAPREELLIRTLVACEAAGIPARILVNKSDLPQTAALLQHLAYLAELDYPLLALSARTDAASLAPLVTGLASVLVGASGMGKSTLLNALIPGANASTGQISAALDAGRHTTTRTRSYDLPGGGCLIDSPGMQEFGLHHLDAEALRRAFPEIRSRAGQCRFHNCRHLKEPGCAVLAAVAAGEMRDERWRVYRGLLRELEAVSAY